ncbi:hypothetical protein D3C72_710800 [compost metagenome]
MQFVFIAAEGDGVLEVHLFAGFRQLIRRPVSDDVVVGFIVGWNFNQLDFPFTPIPFRRDPGAWTQIVTIVEIFKARELTTALEQTKALRVFHRKAADRQVFRVVQRTPDPLAVARKNRQAVGVVQFRAEVGRRRGLVRPEQEHTGQWRNAQFAHFVAQVNFGLHVDNRVTTWNDHKTVGTGCTRGVQQCVDSQAFVRRFWTLDPELTKTREFFTRRQRRVDCQTTRRETVNLAGTDHAEIAGPQHADNFVVFIFAVDGVKHFKACKSQVFNGVFIVFHIAKIKIIRVVLDLTHRSGRHLIDGNRGVEIHTLMIKLKLERGFNVVPVRFIVIELDLLIVRIFHVAENGGQVTFWRLIAFVGQRFCLFCDIIDGKRPCRRGIQ